MIDQKQLEVVDKLYKSVLTPEHWPSALDELSNDINAFSINLFIGDKILVELQNSWISQRMQSSFSAYIEQGFHLYELPIAETLLKNTQHRGLVRTIELEDLHNQESNHPVQLSLVDQWLAKEYNITSRYLAALNQHPSQFDSLCVSYNHIKPDHACTERGNFYLPHIANLVNVSRPFLLLKARFNAVLEVLDRFKLGVFLVTSAGELIEHNSAAQKMLKPKDALFLSTKNRLRATQESADSQLKAAINSMCDSRSSNTKSIRFAVQKASSNAKLLIEISPLVHVDLSFGALIIASDPEETSIINTAHFTELFNLTRSEQDVCQLLAEGDQINTIADKRSTAPETVRSQVKSVLAKTQTSRQVDLVRLAHSINIPVDDGLSLNSPNKE